MYIFLLSWKQIDTYENDNTIDPIDDIFCSCLALISAMFSDSRNAGKVNKDRTEMRMRQHRFYD
jgi:hypothetical protein